MQLVQFASQLNQPHVTQPLPRTISSAVSWFDNIIRRRA
jgi:hypothetical protein